MGTYIRIALRNIWKQKKRSLLLASAIVCGMTLITLAGSFSNGAGRNIIRMGTTLRTGHLNITGLVKVRGTVFQQLPDMEKTIKTIRRTLPGVERIESRISLMASIFNPARELGSRRGFVYGVDFLKEKRLRKDLVLIAGDYSELSKMGRVLIFRRTAEKLDLKVGDTLSITAKIRNTRFGNTTGTLDLQVAAIAENTKGGQMSSIYLPIQDMRKFLGYSMGSTGTLLVYLKDSSDIDKNEQLLRNVLSKQHPLTRKQRNMMMSHLLGDGNEPGWKSGYRLKTTTFEQILQNEMLVKRSIDLISWLLLVILVVIVFAGISNSLWMSIRERTSEVGTLRAIGMGRRQVLSMFLAEGLLLGAGAATIGALTGIALSGLLDLISIGTGSSFFSLFSYRGSLSFLIQPGESLRLIFFTTAVTAAASILPAARAAKMRPINAINHIG